MNYLNALRLMELENNYNKDDLKKNYQKLAKRYHPDKTNGDKDKEERFKQISEAYQFLLDYKKPNVINIEDLLKNFNFNNKVANEKNNFYPLPNQQHFINIKREIVNGKLVETKIEKKNGVTRQTRRIIEI